MLLKIHLLLFTVLIVCRFGLAQQTHSVQPEPNGETAIKMPSDRLMTSELLWSLGRVYDPQVSPDGKHVLYTVTWPNIEKNRSMTNLYVVPVEGGPSRRLTTSSAADYNGRWSPDGSQISFISTRGGSPQIHLISLGGGEARKITDIENGVDNLSWSPAGEYLACTSDVALTPTLKERYPDLPKATVKVYDSIPVRHWDEWTDEKFRHLFIIPLDGGEARDLMDGERYETPMKPFGGTEQIAWSPDGKEIAYTSKKGPRYAESTNSDLYIVDIGNGETTNISTGMPGFDRDPLYSPDGKWIAFHSMATAGNEADRNRLMLFNRKTGEITELSGTLDQWVGNTVWARESKSMYFSADTKGCVQLYHISVPDGKWKLVTTAKVNHDGGLDITPDGKTLVYGRRHFNRPTEIYTVPAAGGTERKLSSVNDRVFGSGDNSRNSGTYTVGVGRDEKTHENDANNIIKQAKIEERWIKAKDGKDIHTWIIYPPDFDPTLEYPLITYCQGGPQIMVSQFFSFAWNFLLMASKGYIVVAPNRRGLPGFGQEWNDAISRDWGGMPMQDILSVHDEIIKEPFVDGNRATAIGASAGGYAVFWLAGNHEGRFKAFVSHCGVFNLESMYGATEELWFTNWENGGPYWDPAAKANYDKHSPHRYAQNWDTPILIVTGRRDFRVPYSQSLEAFTVAQVNGIPSKLIYYPHESHWVQHPQEQILWFREFFDFLGKHCR